MSKRGLPSLSGRIFRSVLAFTLVGIVMLTLMFAGIFYATMMQLPGTRDAMAEFFGSDLLVCVLATLMVGVVLAFAISRLITANIVRPLEKIDPSDPLKGSVYAEMEPLLRRIDLQQRTLRTQNEELARAESLRRDFSANVSHEMKTPLQVISGYAELMENGLVPPEDVPRFAGLIHQESQAMRALINDVLVLSRLDAAAPGAEPLVLVNLASVAERVVERLQKVAADAQVRLTLAAQSVWVRGNEMLLEQMVYNLVENAIRYNHEGGSVWVEVDESDERDEEAAPSAVERQGRGLCPTEGLEPSGGVWAEGVAKDAGSSGAMGTAERDVAVVRVRDTGAGIPADKQEQVFERFYRLEKSRSKETGGTGLGLAIVKHAVLYHEGTVEVESEEGFGTTFTVTLPAAEGPLAVQFSEDGGMGPTP